MDRQVPKQNIIEEYFGKKIKLQFEFCPKCTYFKSCYEDDGKPHYINPECLEDYYNGVYD